MAINKKKKKVDFTGLEDIKAKDTGRKVGNKRASIDWSDLKLDMDSFKNNLEPDLFTKFDLAMKNMSNELKSTPYGNLSSKAVINMLPVDSAMKLQLQNGNTSLFKEVYGTPALHALNQMLFNYPRALSGQLGYEYPQGKTLPGQVLASAAGVAGALVPFGLGEAQIAARIPQLAGKGFFKTATRGAIAGGAQGFTYSPEDPFDMKMRAIQAGTGVVLGGMAAGIFNRIGALKGAIKRFRRRKFSTPKQRVETRRAKGDALRKQQELDGQKVYDEAKDILGENINELQNDVSRQHLRGKVPKVEQAFDDFRTNLNEIYEVSIDDISNDIGNVSKKEAYDSFMQLVDEINTDPDLKGTNAAIKVKSFTKSLKPGKRSKEIDFKTLNTARKKLLSRRFKGDVDDVVYTMFRKKFGDFTDSIDPTGKFSELNKRMAPQLDFKHKFIRKMKVYDQYETSGIESLLKKYSDPRDTITLGEKRLMEDTLNYLSQFGVNIDDLLAATQRGAKVEKTLARIDIQRSKIRKLQDVKLEQVMYHPLKRHAIRLADMGVRIAVARYLLRAVDSLKHRESVGESATTR